MDLLDWDASDLSEALAARRISAVELMQATLARIEAVNGKAYSAEVIQDAITKAKDGTPIELLVKRGEDYRTVSIDYTGGLRWPWLVKKGDGETLLDRFLEARR